MIYSSTKHKVIFSIWVISLIIIFYSIFNIHKELNNAVSNRFEERQKVLTYSLESQTQTYLTNRSLSLKTLAKVIAIEPNNIQNNIEEYYNIVKSFYVLEIQYIDGSGAVKYTTDSSQLGKRYSSAEFYKWCRNLSNYQQIKISTNDDSDLTFNNLRTNFRLITPVYFSSNSRSSIRSNLKFKGALVFKIDLDSLLSQNIRKLSQYSRPPEFMIVNDKGLIIYPYNSQHPPFTPQKLNDNYCLSCHQDYPLGLNTQKKQPFNPFLINENISLNTKNIGERIVSIDRMKLPGIDWLVITSSSYSLIQTIEKNARLKFFIILLLIIIISIGGSIIIYRNYTRKQKAEEEITRLVEKHKLEAQLLESEKRYKLVVEKSPLPIILYESQNIFYANDSCIELFGVNNKNEIIGKPFKLFFNGAKRVLNKQDHDKVSNNIKESPHESKLVRADGKIIDVEIIEMEFNLEGKRVTLAICSDVTLKKKEEDAILKFNKELQDLHSKKNFLFSVIAQDLKSPFQSLVGYTDLLANDLDTLGKNEIKLFSVAINKNARIYYNLLDGLLQWATIQIQSESFLPKAIDLSSIVNDTIRILEHNAAQKGIELVNDIPEGILVSADYEMLSIILRNLITNSIKFSYPTGKVTVTAYNSSEKVTVNVVDNGQGIQEKYLKELFKFEKISSSPGTRGEIGNGLGLTICRDLIEKHGGTFWAASNPDIETTFSFTLGKFT